MDVCVLCVCWFVCMCINVLVCFVLCALFAGMCAFILSLSVSLSHLSIWCFSPLCFSEKEYSTKSMQANHQEIRQKKGRSHIKRGMAWTRRRRTYETFDFFVLAVVLGSSIQPLYISTELLDLWSLRVLNERHHWMFQTFFISLFFIYCCCVEG